MKLKINSEMIKKIIIYTGLVILVLLSTTGILYNTSFDFLKETMNLSLSNLGLVTGIKILAGTVDFLQGIQDIIEKIFNYFLAINGLIFFQMTLLKLSNLIFFRILIFIICLLLFFKSLRKISLKVLLILLFINPGLQLYVLGVKIISYQANLELGKSINEELQTISKSIGETTSNNNEEYKSTDNNANTSLLGKAKNFLSQTFNKTKDMLEKTITNILKIANKLLELVINYFVSMMILFLILPVIYFLILYLITKKYFFQVK